MNFPLLKGGISPPPQKEKQASNENSSKWMLRCQWVFVRLFFPPTFFTWAKIELPFCIHIQYVCALALQVFISTGGCPSVAILMFLFCFFFLLLSFREPNCLPSYEFFFLFAPTPSFAYYFLLHVRACGDFSIHCEFHWLFLQRVCGVRLFFQKIRAVEVSEI